MVKHFISLISTSKLFHAAGPAMANAHSRYRVFEVRFGSISLTAVGADVKYDIEDHCMVKHLSVWMAEMHIWDM